MVLKADFGILAQKFPSFNKLRFPVENFHISPSYDVIPVFGRCEKSHKAL